MRIPLATDFKNRTGNPDKDARQRNSYIEVKGEEAIIRKRPSAQGGVSVGSGTAQGGYGTVLFWSDTAYPITEATGTDWNGATPYVIGDHVSVGFVDYWALADNTNSQPPNSNWSRSRVPPAVSPYSWTDGTLLSAVPYIQSNQLIAWSGSKYCYIKGDTGYSYTSANGLSWSSNYDADLITQRARQSVIHNGSVFCGVYIDLDTNEAHSLTSSDGISWTNTATGFYASDGGSCEMAVAGTAIYSVATGGQGIYKSSNNGASWTFTEFPSPYTEFGYYPIAWNGAVLCVVPNQGSTASNVAWTSPDGVTWTQRTLPNTAVWYGIAVLGNIICAVDGSNAAVSSDNGVTWTITALTSAYSIASDGSKFIIVKGSSSSTYYSSTDGISWVTRSFPLTKEWQHITYGAKFLAVDSALVCATSTTGL